MSTKLINFLFISFLLFGFFSTVSSIENQNYNLSFELDEDDLPGIEQFNHYFSKNEEEDTDVIYEENDDNYYSIDNLEKSGKLKAYITENPDYFDDLSYVHNYDQIKQIKNDQSKLDQMGENYKVIVAKLLVHNALRNTFIEYEEEISI